jgi:hypothetical protein
MKKNNTLLYFKIIIITIIIMKKNQLAKFIHSTNKNKLIAFLNAQHLGGPTLRGVTCQRELSNFK